jgi:RNA-directed DNA polymerase
VISPCLLNVALHGLEEAAGVRYKTSGTRAGATMPGSPIAVRYADDVVVLCHSQEQAEHVRARLAEWLAPRGLAFNEDKTRIVHLNDGFDFLGFNIRRYQNRKLLIKPSKAAIRRVRERLASETRNLRGSNAAAVTAALNPVIRGWAAYYRGAVSSRVFSSLDDYMWKLTWKWATWRHNNKPKRWIVGRYFGKFNTFRNARWVFGDRDSGACLVKFSWTNIERHVPVTGAASPDDPALARYWAGRRRKARPPLDRYTLRLLSRQDGRCPLCRDHLLPPDQPPQSPQQWEQWWLRVTRRATATSYLTCHGRPGPPTVTKPASCTHPASGHSTPASAETQHFNPRRPRGLPEPYAATSGTHGSEGAPARQRAGATRLHAAARRHRHDSRRPDSAIRRHAGLEVRSRWVTGLVSGLRARSAVRCVGPGMTVQLIGRTDLAGLIVADDPGAR